MASNCQPNVLITGYWPPTNEMLRTWAPGEQWQGKNWQKLGYDVYAHFPEFPPDGDPTNDDIGDPGSVGTGELKVDYQATSRDFWRLVNHYQPRILITTSRGGDIEWELEAIEGGHGIAESNDPSSDWIPDQFGNEFLPAKYSVDARSWRAISEYRMGNTLSSKLPLAQLVPALTSLNILNVAVNNETSGNYLSGFIGLHGLYYNVIEPNNIAAGHIHVGRHVKHEDATVMMEETLKIILQTYPACTNEEPQ